MTSSADMVGATPVDELVSVSRRQKDLARAVAFECRPNTSERVGVLGGIKPPVIRGPLKRRKLAVNFPRGSSAVCERATWGEPQFAARAPDTCFAVLLPRNQVDPFHRLDAL